MVSVVDQLLSGRADLVAPVGVDREVGLEGVVLLQQALYGSHVLAQVWHGQQLLLFRDPKNYRKKHFVSICQKSSVKNLSCTSRSESCCI
jgi:hypothetical protein